MWQFSFSVVGVPGQLEILARTPTVARDAAVVCMDGYDHLSKVKALLDEQAAELDNWVW